MKPPILPFIFFTFACCAQKEQCLMPQSWIGITPFGWQADTLSDSDMHQISSVEITLDISHGWGGGSEKYTLVYELQGDVFQSRIARHEKSGRVHPPDRKGEGAKNQDSLFQRHFNRERLNKVLRNIQNPSPFWYETDFGYARNSFSINLTEVVRTSFINYRGCEDCSSYSITILFLAGKDVGAKLSLRFDSIFRLPKVEDTAIKAFQVRKMLEWMYLYQLCHLFFPDDVALNNTHFNEKSITSLEIWAKKFFPEKNR